MSGEFLSGPEDMGCPGLEVLALGSRSSRERTEVPQQVAGPLFPGSLSGRVPPNREDMSVLSDPPRRGLWEEPLARDHTFPDRLPSAAPELAPTPAPGPWLTGHLLLFRWRLQRPLPLVLAGAPARDVQSAVLWGALLQDVLRLQPVRPGRSRGAGPQPASAVRWTSERGHGKQPGGGRAASGLLMGQSVCVHVRVWVCACAHVHLLGLRARTRTRVPGSVEAGRRPSPQTQGLVTTLQQNQVRSIEGARLAKR